MLIDEAAKQLPREGFGFLAVERKVDGALIGGDFDDIIVPPGHALRPYVLYRIDRPTQQTRG
ncbi:hypothetical protein [Rhizobium tropici]|uniref:hypothetical protein n=1 Tax=Rhizobium tropici TaxID=398 RepID=UPI001FEF2779|nr:hypothetical protein [Rhizobium tropici]